jgi:hypothetical protein
MFLKFSPKPLDYILVSFGVGFLSGASMVSLYYQNFYLAVITGLIAAGIITYCQEPRGLYK